MKIGIGQDSHRFCENGNKKIVLGGVFAECDKYIDANSDGDVVFHALTNAVSGVTCVNVLGEEADKMCADGIVDSAQYLKAALKHLGNRKISNVSIAIECAVPKITPIIPQMRENIASVLQIKPDCVGITATSGENLTPFGKGEGIQVFCTILVEEVNCK